MADIISTLFGVKTPVQDTVSDYRTKQAMDFGTLWGQATQNQYAPQERRNAYIQQQGAQAGLANKAINAIGGMFGMKDPMLEKASAIESILQQTQQELGVEAQNPAKLYPILAQKLANSGFQQEALQVGQVAQKALQDYGLNEAKIANENAQTEKYKAESIKALREGNPIQALFFKMAEKSSPQSVAKALNSGMDIALLDNPDVVKYSPLAQQLMDAGFQYGSPEFATKMMEFMEADKVGKTKGSGNVSVNLGGINVDAKKVSEEVGKIAGKDAGEIQNPYSQLSDFGKAKDMLKAGIFTGPFAKAEMGVAKTTRQNLDKVKRTEQFKVFISQNVIARLKDIGGNDTKEEREYLEKMVGGDIALEEDTILEVINQAEQKLRDKIKRTQLQVESASTGKPIPLEPLGKDGATAVSKSGKPIIFRNGNWEYQ